MEDAMAALQQAVDANHPDESIGALLYQGVVFYKTGRFDEAERAYRDVAQSGHPEFVPTAQASLADLARKRRT